MSEFGKVTRVRTVGFGMCIDSERHRLVIDTKKLEMRLFEFVEVDGFPRNRLIKQVRLEDIET